MTAWPHSRLSRAHVVGIAHLAAAGWLLAAAQPWRLPLGIWLNPAALVLATYIGLCITGSFLPGWQWFLPVVSHGARGRPVVALSFDDGPDPVTTPALLEVLGRHGARAAFFLTGRNAQAHPALVARIRAEGHEVGNHSMSHDPILMLRTLARLERDVADCQAVLLAQGVRPLAFRPPVGITNPRLPIVLSRLGLGCVCFSNRPLDFGNKRVERLAERVLATVRPGDVVLLHDVAPPSEVPLATFLAEVEKIVVGLKARGLAIEPLSQVVGLPVMDGDAVGARPVVAQAPRQAAAEGV